MSTTTCQPCIWNDAPSNHGMGHLSMIGREVPATAAISFGPRAAPVMLSSRSDVLHAASSASAPPWSPCKRERDDKMHCIPGRLRVDSRIPPRKGFLRARDDNTDWRITCVSVSMLTRRSPGSDRDVSRSRASCRSASSDMLWWRARSNSSFHSAVSAPSDATPACSRSHYTL